MIALLSIESAASAQAQFFRNNSILDSLQSITASTIPPKGDVNPYGLAFVPAGFPGGANIGAGDVLVANFKNSTNAQGTGTTIVSITPTGQQALFATSPLIGLSTALGALSRGFVVVGNLPVTYPGDVATPQQGSLQFFNRNGTLVLTLNDANLLDSPWDLTINDQGSEARRRFVLLPQWAMEQLRELRQREKWIGAEDPVFSGKSGRQLPATCR